MRTLTLALIAGLALAAPAAAQDETQADYAKIATSKGDIYVDLAREEAPKTVENFLAYATSGHYDRTIWHRVVPGFVIQGGGYSRSMIERPPEPPIPNEAKNGLKNERGTLAMARHSDCDSARAQFFINLKHNTALDYDEARSWECGYTVFGRVVSGMDVVDAIAAVETGPKGVFDKDVPVEPVYIERVDPVGEADVPQADE